MKVEILTNNYIQNAFKDLDVQGTRKYRSNDAPWIEVWEIDKTDVHKLENVPVWEPYYGWWYYAKRSNMGTAYSFLTINGCDIIAWDGASKDNTYDNLLDYFYNEFEITNPAHICEMAVDLAKYNGITLAELFKKYQG